jgi:serine protease
MKIKIYAFCLLNLFNLLNVKAQENLRTFQNNEYVKINNEWNLLNTTDLKYYPIQNNFVTIKFVENTSQEVINNFAIQNNLTFVRKAITGWCDFQINDVSYDIFVKCNTIKTSNVNIINKIEIPTHGSYNTIPNDTNYATQWHLNKINALGAWNIETGKPFVKVAVIDSGTDWTHNDLGLGNDSYQNIYLNNGEDAWSNPNNPLTGNGIDDDGNCLVDDWKGWDFDQDNNDSRSTTFHGTSVAGVLGAKTNNNLGVAGVAGGFNNEGVKILPIGIGATSPNSLAVDDAILYAGKSGCKVINLSISVGYSQAIDEAINYTYNIYGAIVVVSSGNFGLEAVAFPASHPLVIAVGATTQNDTRLLGSNYGENLFITAPGINIKTTTLNNNYANFDLTSASTPIVSGVIALMYSVNPCLTQEQVKNILKDTAEKVGNYNYQWNPDNLGHSVELGYGRINAFLAVQAAQGLNPYNLDLIIKDGVDDVGEEPNTTTQYLWTSPDIWIRNNDDNGIEHQNPEYHPTEPNYAYIRVKNKSCIPTYGNEKVNFYWAKAGTSLAWPTSWNGNNYFSQGPLLGAPVGEGEVLPILQAGQETIIKIPFLVPNPNIYNWFQGWEQWHFCLLARIETINDTLTETNDLVANVKNNNGIAWKNVSIVDNEANLTKATIAVGNPSDVPRTFFLEFVVEDVETGKPIFEEAEIGIKMDEVLYNAWERGGKESQLLDPTLEEKIKIVKGNNVILENISFNPNELGSLTLNFNFLTKEITDKYKFKYHIIQRDAFTGYIIGGETFEIKKKTRNLFEAIAPDKEVDVNQAITISADDINEPAIYNWYDEQGNLIYSGKDLQIANAVAEKYKLEVISTIDGFKDYTEIEVKLKPSSIESISPNPSNSNTTIAYKLNGANSAYLMVISLYGGSVTSNNYILDVNANEINLNVSNYTNAIYTVALVVDGIITDAKTLIKQ